MDTIKSLREEGFWINFFLLNAKIGLWIKLLVIIIQSVNRSNVEKTNNYVIRKSISEISIKL